MDLSKTVQYTMTLGPADVTVLVAEFQQLFKAKPELAKVLPNLKILADGLASRLAIQDYNPAMAKEIIDGIQQRGLNKVLDVAPEAPKAANEAVAKSVEAASAALSKAKKKLSAVKKEA